MRLLLQILGALVIIPAILILLALATSVILSPPWGGKATADTLSLPYPAVIAHRGASYLAPESTLPAYLLAREIGADYLEADLQRTADGVIVIFHDDTLERTTNVREVFPERAGDFIETFTYGELSQLDAGSWFNEAFPERARESYVGLKILTLEELIDAVEEGNNNPGLYLETKSANRHPGMEEQIVEILRERGWLETAPDLTAPEQALNWKTRTPTVNVAASPARVIFQSFHLESILRLRELASDTIRVLLISEESEAEYGWRPLIDFASATSHGIGPVGYLGWPWKTGSVHRNGLIVHIYTINEPWQLKLLSFFGADGFFTDRSDIALTVLDRGGPVDLDAVFREIDY